MGQLYDEQRYVYRGKFAESRFERNCLAEYARAADVFLAYLLSKNGGKSENMGRRFEPIQGLSSLKKATVRTEWADEVHLLRFSQLRKKGGSFCSQVPDIAASI